MSSGQSESKSNLKISVIGAGAWGTALAQVAAIAGNDVALLGRHKDHMLQIQNDRENGKYIPGVLLHEAITASADIDEAYDSDVILLVVPAQSLREASRKFAASLRADVPVVVCAKGIETKTHKFTTDVVRDELPDNQIGILSGPSFAHDVVRKLPTAVTVASSDRDLCKLIVRQFSTPYFRLYYTDDVRGVEIGGATKNVLAIACGIADGYQLGASAKAAIMARGFSEIRRLASALGAESETLMGLSGLGDLVLTCSSDQSRNFAFGLRLGKGEAVEIASRGKLVEGAFTASALLDIANSMNVDMPIVKAVNSVLFENIAINKMVEMLMNRPNKMEYD